MPQKHRTPGADVIEQLVPVGVEQMLRQPSLDDEGLAADGTEGPDGAVYAADENSFGTLKDFARAPPRALKFWFWHAHNLAFQIITLRATARRPWRGR